MDTSTEIIVRCLHNATEFFLMSQNGSPITPFKKGLMRQVTLDTTLPNLTLRKEGGPQRISTGALVGKTLEFGDEKTFVMPKEVLVATIIHYDFAQRCFFNSNTGHRVDSMDFALLDSGLVVGGWINRI